MNGSPIRFVAVVIGGWIAVRLVALMPSLPVIGGGAEPVLAVANAAPPSVRVDTAPVRSHGEPAAARTVVSPAVREARPAHPSHGGMAVEAAETQEAAPGPRPAPRRIAGASGTSHPASLPDRPLAIEGRNRWSGSAWLLWRRGDDRADLARAGRLGASQAGVRLDYTLAPASPLRPAVYGRLSGALELPVAAEAALGIAVHPPIAIPLTVAVERRMALSTGARDAFALVVAGGLDKRRLGHGLTLEGYAQAGLVGLASRDAFIDGRIAVGRVVHQRSGLAVGAALSGGAQPRIARLDIGPQVSVPFRMKGAAVRLGIEWRHRIAGRARPASGVAVTLGTDF